MFLVASLFLIATVAAASKSTKPKSPKEHLKGQSKDIFTLSEGLAVDKAIYTAMVPGLTPEIKSAVDNIDFKGQESYKQLDKCIKAPIVPIPKAKEVGKEKPVEAAKPEEQLDAMNSLIRDLRARCDPQLQVFSKFATDKILDTASAKLDAASKKAYKRRAELYMDLLDSELDVSALDTRVYELGLAAIGVIAIIVGLIYYCCRRT